MPGDSDTDRTLFLLRQIEQDAMQTQRSFAKDVGIAVGLVNTYVRRCVKKGWIKVRKAPAQRYAYYITPKGFAEKSRLVANYLSSSLHFFREARSECREALLECAQRGMRRIVLYGEGDLAEIAALSAREAPVELVALVAPGRGDAEWGGIPVAAELDAAPPHDAVLITDISHPQGAYDGLLKQIPADRILTLPLLRITRNLVVGKR